MTVPAPEEQALMQAIIRLKNAHLPPKFCGLSKAEFFALEYTHAYRDENPGNMGISVSKLAEKLAISAPAVSRTLRELEDRGLIDRADDKEDRRTTYLTLTEKGESIRLECWNRMRRLSSTMVSRLGKEHLGQLAMLLDQFLDVWQEEQAKEKD